LLSGPEVLFKTCVAMKFMDDDDNDAESNLCTKLYFVTADAIVIEASYWRTKLIAEW